MSLKSEVEAALKRAMLAKDEAARDALRLLKADLLQREVDLGRDLTPDEEVAAVKRAVKTREESIQQYEAAGRVELVAKERLELAVVQQFLPKALSEPELRAEIEAIVRANSLASKRDMGRLMKELQAKHGAAVDGRLAAKLAGEFLQG